MPVDVHGRGHQAAGTPGGGQFTASARTEAPGSVTLPEPHFYVTQPEYLWNTADRDDTRPINVEVATVFANALIDAIDDDPDWLPPVDRYPDLRNDESSDFYDADDEGYIESLHELSDPTIARAACIVTSEAVQCWFKAHGAHAFPEIESIDLAQALSEPDENLTCHYAVLVTPKNDEAPFIVDYTFAQVDAEAPFPLVTSSGEWETAVHTGLEEHAVRLATP